MRRPYQRETITHTMEDRMTVVMASVWDYAPPSMETVDEESEDDAVPTLAEQPPCSSWPPVFRAPQRWLVAAISVLFLYWMWSEDRVKSNNKSSDAAPPPTPVVASVPEPVVV